MTLRLLRSLLHLLAVARLRLCSLLLCSLLLLSSCLLCSCQNDESGIPSLPSRTVLCYLATDNNLSGETDEKIQALLAGWSPEMGELLFYVDRPLRAATLCRATAAGKAAGKAEVVRTYTVENSASSEVWGRVVREVTERYPAASYGLIFFSHASGWLPEGSAVLSRAVGASRSIGASRAVGAVGISRSLGTSRSAGSSRSIGLDTSREMELVDFASAIPDRQFAFILFEACLMGGIEVAYELSEKTDYLLVSPAEIVSPGFTPVYATALAQLYRPVANLSAFAQHYANHCAAQTGYRQSMTLSVIQTAPLHELHRLFHSVAIPVAEPSPTLQSFDRLLEYHLYFDFGDWVNQVVASPQREAILAQIDRCVAWKAFSPEFMYGHNGFPIRRYSGLTTYVAQQRFPHLNEAYQELKWYKK